jgi:hypothetical protein
MQSRAPSSRSVRRRGIIEADLAPHMPVERVTGDFEDGDRAGGARREPGDAVLLSPACCQLRHVPRLRGARPRVQGAGRSARRGGRMSRAAAVRATAWTGPEAAPSRLGTGWEAAVLLLLTTMLLCIGIVSVYSASAVMAPGARLPDYYFVVRQATGAAARLRAARSRWRSSTTAAALLAWPILLLVCCWHCWSCCCPGAAMCAGPQRRGRWLRARARRAAAVGVRQARRSSSGPPRWR